VSTSPTSAASVNTAFETAVIIAVLANDSDPDGTLDPATVTIVDQPTRGTAQVNPDGTITYTPNPGESGEDSFTYTVADDQGAVSDPATVTIGIGTAPNQPPVAENDQVNTGFETAIIIAVLANDSDPDGTLDPATVTIVDQPTRGTAEVNPDGTITYTPNPGESGEDSFTYTVADDQGAVSNPATVDVTVDPPVEQPPDDPEPDPLLSLNLITGTGGNDRIIGSEDDDIIFGLAGNDQLEGRGGDDIVFGGRGNDRISGGTGDDILVGGPGNDQLDGGPGLDIALFAGDFADFRIISAGPRVQVQDRGGNNEGNNTLTAIEILQFDDGFFDVASRTFNEGYANDRVEALMTRDGFSTDPSPDFVTPVSVAQVENLVTPGETVT
jgi:Ca2+-binding RTX toxin-like protein